MTTPTTATTSTKASTTVSGSTGSSSCDSYISSNPWQGGDAGSIQFKVPETSNGWTLEIGFNYPPTDFFMSEARRINGGSRCTYDFTNWVYNKNVNAGSIVKFDFNFHYQWDSTIVPKIEFLSFSSTSVICGAPSSCSATQPTTTTTTTLLSSSSTSTSRSPAPSTSTSTSISTPASSSTSTSRAPSTSTSTTTSTSRWSSSATSTSTSSSPSMATSTSTIGSSSSSTSTSRSPTPSTSKTSSTSFSTNTSTVTSTPSTCEPDYNYADVIKKSLMFYEAQRSGQLPITNRIPWRLTSTLNDGSLVGVDLSGGYFDAGDFVKFTFPAASAITVLAWGMLEFEEGYKFADQYQQGLDAIKWATDFFIKCHTEKYKFWAQVGEGHIDHASWGRATELDDSTRKCHALSPGKPGSDLLGEVSAALAANSLVFKKVDSLYSDNLLNHAKDLYDFAKTYKGKYSDSISDAKVFYNSWSGYYDELAWAASWLYYATNDLIYLTDAEATWNSGQMSQISEG
ncbi:uncharacterized protein LOC130614103 [Hydractinia symbiolongicarpus]|uniref:uncharacterized protein LOC130614103 n=1 Tax=Hydractinia symbiolongicarpus TaxID=13093 RepID=UPI00254FFEFA|nr:uncharacterized protein LOC130614103 [Hydractinia symbiolongicarpus]